MDCQKELSPLRNVMCLIKDKDVIYHTPSLKKYNHPIHKAAIRQVFTMEAIQTSTNVHICEELWYWGWRCWVIQHSVETADVSVRGGRESL